MYHELFWVILVFGVGILLTYANLMSSGMFLGSLVEPIPIRLWACSMLLTIVSFVYISNQWIWHLPNNSTVLGMYCIFLLGALTWSPMIADSLRREQKTLWVAVSLWLAGAGSIGLLVLACQHSSNTIMIVASTYLVFHHVCIDAIAWYIRWHIPGASRPLFTTLNGESNLNADESKYDNLEYI